jgi:Putative Actinobacterial Holin-X, holin superfamily III
MAIVQLVFAFISRSLSRILSTVFGWAVVALFGETSGPLKIWLSALVGVAAAWPILLAGIAWPKITALVLAFVPLPTWAPAWTVRIVWVALALVVPLSVGLTTAVQRPTHAMSESRFLRMARGFPITFGIAGAFLIVFVTVPALRVMSLIRRRIDLHIPLVTDVDSYEAVATVIARTLTAQGFAVTASVPPWWMTAPSRLLLWVDSTSFRAYVPRRFAYFRGARLEAALYPNGLLLRGREQDTAWAHGILVEALTATPGLQTFDPGAQDIEKQIRRVWQVYRQRPEAHRSASALLGRLEEIGKEIRSLPVPYDEWQIVYRQALQLGRALNGERQLLADPSDSPTSEVPMEDPIVSSETVLTGPFEKAGTVRARLLSTRELLADITSRVSLLVKKEVELATTEVKADLQKELSMVKALAAAVVAGLLGLNMLLVAAVFALAMKMPGWVAALVIGGVVLLIAMVLGSVGWSRRVTNPLAMTRKTLKEDVQWAKERVA